MKKLSMLAIIGGATLLAAAPFSLQWSQKSVSLSLDRADARIGRPGTALSVAGVHRRAYRRAARSAVYVGSAGAAMGRTPVATALGRTTVATAIAATPPHLTIRGPISASGGVSSQFLAHISEVRSRGQAEL